MGMQPEERIELVYDASAAKQGAAEANRAIESTEKTAKRAAAAVGEAAERAAQAPAYVVDKTRGTLERHLRSLEKRELYAGKAGLDRLIAERELSLKQFAGDPKYLEQAKKHWEGIIRAQKEADSAALLERLPAASKRAAAAAAEFSRALRETNAEAKKVQQSVDQIVFRGATAGMSPRQVRLAEIDRDQANFLASNKLSPQQVQQVTAAFQQMRKEAGSAHTAAEQAMHSMGELVGVIGLVAGAYGALRGIIKPIIVDTTLYAARTEQLGIALHAVAKANNISAGTVSTLERQIVKLNVTTQDARGNLARLIAAHVDLGKAAQLARIAQDLGRVSGEGTAMAFERLTHAIVTGQPELLRQLGLSVNLEKAYQRVAKETGRSVNALSEHEKMQIRTNEVIKAAASYAGVYADSLNTVTGRLLSLERKVNEARNAIGERFQAEASGTISVLEWTAVQAEKQPGLFMKIGAAGTAAAGAIALAFGGPLLTAIGAVMIALGGVVAYLEQAKTLMSFAERIAGGMGFDNPGKKEEASAAARLVAAQKFREGAARIAAAYKIQDEANAALIDKKKEDAKKIESAEKRTADMLKQARHSELEGLAKIIEEYKDYRKELGLSAKANADLAQAATIRIRVEARKELRGAASDRVKEIDAEMERRTEADVKRMKDAQAYADETLRIEQQADMERLRTADARIETQKEAELRALAGLHATTLQQEIELVNRRLEIEERYIAKSLAAKARMLNLEMEMELAAIDVSTEAGQARRDAIIKRYGAVGSRLNQEFEDEITAARETAANRRADIEIDAWKRTFENTRRGVESMLDEMLSRASSFGDVMRSILKAAILQPIKEAASTWIAMLMTGTRAQGGQSAGGFGGVLGRIGIGGLAMGSQGGYAGTPPFIPTGTATAGGGGGGFASYGAGFAGYGKGLLGGLSALGNLGRTTVPILTPGGGMMGTTTAGKGYGGAAGGAMLLGGGILAFDGLRRGGLIGLGETTAGGALIGAKFGGPLGAAIGAAVGFAAGFVRLFIKGATEKAIEKVQKLYKVRIDKNLAQQIVTTAKQQYGGNIDMAIRTAQVRDLIELYAMATGQSIGGMGTKNLPVSLIQSGGMLSQAPSYYGGTRMPGAGGAIPALQAAASVALGGASQTVLKLDGPATTALLRGEAVEVVSDGRLVSRSNVRGQRANAGRRETAALQFAPGLVVG